MLAAIAFTIDEAWGRRRGERHTVLQNLSAPRVYRGGRRLALVFGVVTLVALAQIDSPGSGLGLASLLFVGLSVLFIDTVVSSKGLTEYVEPYARPLVSPAGRWLRSLIALATLSALALAAVFSAPHLAAVPGGYDVYAETLRAGKAPNSAGNISPYSLLQIPAVEVCASRLGPDLPPNWTQSPNFCKPLLLLGAANGSSVLYDAVSQDVLRIPTVKLLLTSQTRVR